MYSLDNSYNKEDLLDWENRQTSEKGICGVWSFL